MRSRRVPHAGGALSIPPAVPAGHGVRQRIDRYVRCVRHNDRVTHPETLAQHEPLDAAWLAQTVRRCLTEDLGGEPGDDVTTRSTISPEAEVEATVAVREPGVVAGIDIIAEALEQVSQRFSLPAAHVRTLVADGDLVEQGTVLASIKGRGHTVLMAERTVLNLMSRACGVATHTRRWVDALEGTGARVLDTRKTTPLLRELDKYAVRCGGGVNKRFGLYDVAMVKDNHIVAAGSVRAAIEAIRSRFADVPIQVEVESREQAFAALDAGVDFLMLDNMAPSQMEELVAEIRATQGRRGHVWIEATGGLTLDNVREVAATGVDFMSVGALTHSSPIVDIGLDLH